jgi:hypothetical protein
MKIEPYLTPRNHTLTVSNELFNSRFSGFVVKTRVMRMNADSGINRRMLTSEFNSSFKRATVRVTSANVP